MTLDSNTVSQDDATVDHDLDAASLSAIRSILTEEDAPKPRRSIKREPRDEVQDAPRDVAPLRRKAEDLPPLQSADLAPDTPDVPAKRRFSLRRKRAAEAPARPAPQPKLKAPKAARVHKTAIPEGEAGIMARIKAYRPKPAHIALGVFALLIVMRPWLVFGLAFLFAIILVGVFLITGYDGFWKGAMNAGKWYAKRRPERAAVLNKRLDDFAIRWDAILDRFPEGSVDGLYLPDFGELAVAEKRHEDAVERRLAGLSGKPS